MIALCAVVAAVFVMQPGGDRLFEEMLSSTPTLRGLAAEPARYKLQITVGEIDAASDVVTWHEYRPDAEYFYPASTIKLLAAALAPGELRRIASETGVPVGLDSPLVFHPLFEGETVEDRDETDVTRGVISAAHEIRKVLLVSDNAAFNRLYELVGHEGLNSGAQRIGLASVRVTHRLSEARSPTDNRRSPRIEIRAGERTAEIPERVSEFVYPPGMPVSIPIGRGYMTSSGLVAEPLEFADNNRVTLRDLLLLVAGITRPGLAGVPRIDLTELERAFLAQAMGEFPRESANPVYDPVEYADEWGKLFLPGVRRALPGDRARIYNKIGRAYGQSTDAALIVDTTSGRSVLLGVTMYTNDNAILNDNIYEYEALADPAFADIGEFVARRFLLDPGAGDE